MGRHWDRWRQGGSGYRWCEPSRRLYLAIPGNLWQNAFEEPIGQGVLTEYNLRLLVFDPPKGLILQWIPTP
jgi:hypothetical protein